MKLTANATIPVKTLLCVSLSEEVSLGEKRGLLVHHLLLLPVKQRIPTAA